MHRENCLASLIALAVLLAVITGCSLDDRYHYTLSYQIANKTENLITGTLIRDSTYYRHPAIEFELKGGETLELFTSDGGDGATISPPFRQGLLAMKELQINIEDSILVIDAEPDEKWEYTTEESTGIYTFSITEDLLAQ